MATTSGAAEGDTTLVSVDSSGNQANHRSHAPSISSDGRFVAFHSRASNLVANDTNGDHDVFVHDRKTGTTRRVSIASSGKQGNNGSYMPSISPDGRFVAFSSFASNLVPNDTNGSFSIDVFLRDRQRGTTELVSVDSSGEQDYGSSSSPSISPDGRYVAFQSDACSLVPNDTCNISDYTDVFVRDRQRGTTRRVSIASSGKQGNNGSYMPSISADGRFVAFAAYASNLVPNDINGRTDVLIHDRQRGTTKPVSVDSSGNQANGESYVPSISSDGRYVAFQSNATNLVANDTNEADDIFVRDRKTGTTRRVSVDSSGNQANSDGSWPSDSSWPSISSDGRYIAFNSWATNLVSNDTNGKPDIFVRDRQTRTTELVSVNGLSNQTNGDSYVPSISSDGRFVTFESKASNLVTDDTNDRIDIFLHQRDITAPRVTRVMPTDGATGVALKANVVATFSERMDKSTLKKANFKLYKLIRNPNGTTTTKQIENVTVTPRSDGLKATLNPFGGSDRILSKNTMYKVVVSTGALDVFSNPLDQKPRVSGKQPKVWFFKARS